MFVVIGYDLVDFLHVSVPQNVHFLSDNIRKEYIALFHYHIKEERAGIKVRVPLCVLDLVSASHYSTTFYLNTGVVDGRHVELLHVPDPPGQHLYPSVLHDGSYSVR